MSATEQPALNVAAVASCPMIQRKSIEHLKTYSTVKFTIEWICQIPFTRQTREFIAPTIKNMRCTQPLKGIYDTTDLHFDNMLTRLDNCFGSTQRAEGASTLSMCRAEGANSLSMCRPVMGTIASVDKTVRSTDEMITKQVVEPTKKTMSAVVESISKSLSRATPNNTTSVVATLKTNEKGKPAIDQTIEVTTANSASQDRKSVKETVSAVISSLSAK